MSVETVKEAHRRYYLKKKQNPKWVEEQRNLTRERMRKRRKDPETRTRINAQNRKYWTTHKRDKKQYRIVQTERANASLLPFKKACVVCGETCSVCLDFHHKNEDEKMAGVTQLARAKNLDKLKDELKKCIVICSNCHRKQKAGLLDVSMYPAIQIN